MGQLDEQVTWWVSMLLSKKKVSMLWSLMFYLLCIVISLLGVAIVRQKKIGVAIELLWVSHACSGRAIWVLGSLKLLSFIFVCNLVELWTQHLWNCSPKKKNPIIIIVFSLCKINFSESDSLRHFQQNRLSYLKIYFSL